MPHLDIIKDENLHKAIAETEEVKRLSLHYESKS